MSKFAGGLFGGGSSQMAELRAQQAEQARLIADEKAKTDAIEAAQKRLRLGGRRGFLAFKEQADAELQSTTGGDPVTGMSTGQDLPRNRPWI